VALENLLSNLFQGPIPELVYAPYKQKVYLILFSAAFNGLLKSQGMKVKLMVCKKTQSKMNKNAWKQTFMKMQNQQLFSKKDFFSFQNY
jgi:short-subunit dehydrogenase